MCEIDWVLLLEYMKVFLSWPVVILVLALFFIHTFEAPIRDFLSRVTDGEWYGMKLKAKEPQGDQEVAALSRGIPEGDVRQWIVENPDRVIEEYTRAYQSYQWERCMNLIYGTQIDLLTVLNQRGGAGELYTNLGVFHAEHQKRVNRTDYPMSDYMGFLERFGLVEFRGEGADLRLCITPFGQGFLSYIQANYPELWNKKDN